MSNLEILLIWIDAIISLMFISSVWKDNVLAQLAQNLAVGAAIGHAVLISIDTIYRTGISSVLGGNVFTIVGLLFGVLMFGRMTNYKWLARFPTQLVMAVGLGVMFGLSVSTQIFGQLTSTFQNFLNITDSFTALNSVLILVGVATTLAYFLFTWPEYTLKHRDSGAYGIIRKIARVFMMSAFGITFATEEIWYLTVLIGRLWLLLKTAAGL
jgi:hypothetical protein